MLGFRALLAASGQVAAVVGVSYVDFAIDPANASSYTLALDLGAAASDRISVFGVSVGGSATQNVSAVKAHVPNVSTDPTGTACTLAVTDLDADSEVNNSLWYAELPTGTACELVVTCSSTNRCGAASWRVTGAIAVPYDTDMVGWANGAANQSLTALTTPANSAVIGLAGQPNTSITWTWTNLTKEFQELIETSQDFTGASAQFSAKATPTIAANRSSTALGKGCTVLVSFAPNISPPAWTTLESGDWLGDTASTTLGSGTVTFNATDKNIRTATSLVASGEDFDFEVTCGAFTTANGPYVGFYESGTTTGAESPTVVDPVPSVVNGGGSPGYEYGNRLTDTGGAKAAGFMSGVVVRISRRGSTFYVYLDDVLDHTFVLVSDDAAGGFYIGNGGSTSGWSMSGIRYRTGPGCGF